eukprot:TRINITY_DN104821_c0_g1_i1.p1 TRINITY_DN104821_c0_g1~~TRINITY_DN104821_c0_g1_i1.p1  ORF type:complete len:369 (-),score=46.53 TRINITY_DN104821_c0_g1_i1:159-1178(-)
MELRYLRKLRHPAIVTFLGACVIPDNSDLILVEELVIGDNLSTFMQYFGTFATSNVHLRQHLVLDISSGLHYLHSQDPVIVHGDLKPDNIMVESRTLKAKITDFGLACREMTRLPGGTFEWQEPELRYLQQGEHGAGRGSSDIWALGAVCFFICTGLPPRAGSMISGTAAVRDFGEMVRELWVGPRHKKIPSDADEVEAEVKVLLEPVDLQTYRSLCSTCMHPDKDQRPTARCIHDTLRDLSVAEAHLIDSEMNSLPQALAKIRELLRDKHSHTGKVELPPDVLQQAWDVLRDQAIRVKTFGRPVTMGGAPKDKVTTLQSLHAILQMLSWELAGKIAQL